MSTNYDPLKGPDPEEWKSLEEEERIERVLSYHLEEGMEVPNAHVHSAIHAVVEYQIALGKEYPVQKALQRLMKEGLDRHDSIHAIGAVLSKYLRQVGTDTNKSEDFTADYFDEVRQLTVQKWIDEFGE
jgi:Na+/phosphate symporter